MIRALILITALALMAVSILGLSRPAHAAECAPHAAIVAGLARNFGETVVAMGLTGQGTMIEVFASEAGTWTIVQTAPMGTACLIASGGAFATVKESLPPKGIPG